MRCDTTVLEVTVNYTNATVHLNNIPLIGINMKVKTCGLLRAL